MSMSQPLPPLPRSDSKARFMQRIGLNARDARHRLVYNMMKAEAVEGRRRIVAALNPDQDSTASEAILSTSQISVDVLDREIVRIYRDAHPATRHLYNLAVDHGRPNEANWIIRWMLWHVIRYRDRRQHNSSGSGRREEMGSDDEDSAPAPTLSPDTAEVVRQVASSLGEAGPLTEDSSSPTFGMQRYDPVRDQWNR